MNVYENFVQHCRVRGKTPCAVALEIGISKPTVTRWKQGGYPTDATAMKLADYFGVDWNQFRKRPDRIENHCKVAVKRVHIMRKGGLHDC